MIKMSRSSVALNAADSPGAHYRMWKSREVQKTDAPNALFRWVAGLSKSAPGGHIRSLIINCRAQSKEVGGRRLSGYGLELGRGISTADTALFAALEPCVDEIWITAAIASQSGEPEGDGHEFCSKIARQADAYVIAATTRQTADLFLPPYHIDDFEGLVLRYDRKGKIEWQHEYSRGWFESMVNSTRNLVGLGYD